MRTNERTPQRLTNARRAARRPVAAALGCLLLVLLAGCDNAITVAAYERVALGMPVDEVQQILGRGRAAASVVPVSTSRSQPRAQPRVQADPGAARRVLIWEKGDRRIIVTFRDGKVVSKEKQGF